MSTEVEDAYLSDPSPGGKGAKIGLVLSLLANIGLAGGGYYVFREKTDLEGQLDQARAEQVKLVEAHTATIEEMETNFSGELQAVNTQWSEKLNATEESHRAQMGRVYGRLDEIMFESDKTVSYIGQLENKLKSGGDLDRAELESLQMIAGGLTYLREQYQKPLAEFKGLEQFLASQLDTPPAMPTEKKVKFLRRLFSKDFRVEEQAYYQDVGRRQAFEAARQRVVTAYNNAQREMAAITLNQQKYVADLEKLIAGKETELASLDEFFAQSRKILNVHQEILDLQQQEPVMSPPPPVTRP